jgi:hypothetical protein
MVVKGMNESSGREKGVGKQEIVWMEEEVGLWG